MYTATGGGGGGGSASGVFAFDHDTAGTTESDLSTVINGLQGDLDDLGGFVNDVTANWDGDEKDLYKQVQDGWNTNAETVQKILDGVHKAIGSVNTGVTDLRKAMRDSLKEQ